MGDQIVIAGVREGRLPVLRTSARVENEGVSDVSRYLAPTVLELEAERILFQGWRTWYIGIGNIVIIINPFLF